MHGHHSATDLPISSFTSRNFHDDCRCLGLTLAYIASIQLLLYTPRNLNHEDLQDNKHRTLSVVFSEFDYGISKHITALIVRVPPAELSLIDLALFNMVSHLNNLGQVSQIRGRQVNFVRPPANLIRVSQ